MNWTELNSEQQIEEIKKESKITAGIDF